MTRRTHQDAYPEKVELGRVDLNSAATPFNFLDRLRLSVLSMVLASTFYKSPPTEGQGIEEGISSGDTSHQAEVAITKEDFETQLEGQVDACRTELNENFTAAQ